ncbi:MAG: ABC transporter permease [Nitriliruptorales bacterium]|nr:ABC transporter permease [Nitriliruptorales bacterium]
MATTTPPDRVETTTPDAEVSRAISRERGLTRLSRLQTLGVLFGVLGVTLIASVAGALPGDDITLVFGLGDAAPKAALDPPNTVLGIGILFVVAAMVALLDRWTGRYAGVALAVASVLFVPLVLVCAIALSATNQTNLLPLFVESLRLGTPIALGALAGLWCERSGVVNIGIEGMMLAAAGVSFVTYAVMSGGNGGGWLWAAVVIAIFVGGLMGLLHAVLSVTFRTDQIVSGVAINLLAFGLTAFLRREVLLPSGVSSAVTLPKVTLPVLSDIPLVGSVLFSGKPIFFMMFIVFVVTKVVLFRTTWGLRVRSVGENPHAADTLGIDVIKTRYQAVIVGGLIAGLAGAWFTLETVGGFDNGMTNGKGFIALAALIFGKWRPWSAFGGAMLFGFAEALGSRIQFLNVAVGGFPFPSQFLQVLPYVVTIIVLAGAIGRAIPPAADGIPYERPR